MKHTFACAAMLAIVCLAPALTAEDYADIYAAGVSYNPGGTPNIAGTGMYAHKTDADGNMYAFSMLDVLPTTLRPFNVTTNVTAGVARKVVSLNINGRNVPIYIPASVGPSYSSNETGNHVGWAWTTGGMAVVKVKGNWLLMPHVRVVKSSVNNHSDYQGIVGIMIGLGQR